MRGSSPRMTAETLAGVLRATRRPAHRRYRLADHDRYATPHHPRCVGGGGQGQDRRHRQGGRDRAALYRDGNVSTAAAPWRRPVSSTAICIRRSRCRAGWRTKPTRNRSCSTACIPTRRRSTGTTCGSRRCWPRPSCSSTASPASSTLATITPRRRLKASCRPASARSYRVRPSTLRSRCWEFFPSA